MGDISAHTEFFAHTLEVIFPEMLKAYTKLNPKGTLKIEDVKPDPYTKDGFKVAIFAYEILSLNVTYDEFERRMVDYGKEEWVGDFSKIVLIANQMGDSLLTWMHDNPQNKESESYLMQVRGLVYEAETQDGTFYFVVKTDPLGQPQHLGIAEQATHDGAHQRLTDLWKKEEVWLKERDLNPPFPPRNGIYMPEGDRKDFETLDDTGNVVIVTPENIDKVLKDIKAGIGTLNVDKGTREEIRKHYSTCSNPDCAIHRIGDHLGIAPDGEEKEETEVVEGVTIIKNPKLKTTIH